MAEPRHEFGHPDGLPGALADVARATAIEVAVAVARRFGGQDMYVPAEPDRDHPLSRLVGVRAARLIGRATGGRTLYWPTAKTWLTAYSARRRRAEGATIGQIARELGVSTRSVERLVRGVEKGVANEAAPPEEAACPVCGRRSRRRTSTCGQHDPAQLDLFGVGPSSTSS